jgi:hypothetical protein
MSNPDKHHGTDEHVAALKADCANLAQALREAAIALNGAADQLQRAGEGRAIDGAAEAAYYRMKAARASVAIAKLPATT